MTTLLEQVCKLSIYGNLETVTTVRNEQNKAMVLEQEINNSQTYVLDSIDVISSYFVLSFAQRYFIPSRHFSIYPVVVILTMVLLK